MPLQYCELSWAGCAGVILALGVLSFIQPCAPPALSAVQLLHQHPQVGRRRCKQQIPIGATLLAVQNLPEVCSYTAHAMAQNQSCHLFQVMG